MDWSGNGQRRGLYQFAGKIEEKGCRGTINAEKVSGWTR
jgi:hypothetical protein